MDSGLVLGKVVQTVGIVLFCLATCNILPSHESQYSTSSLLFLREVAGG